MNNYLDNLQFKIDWVQGIVKTTDVAGFFKALERNVSKQLCYENFVLMPYSIKFYKRRFQLFGSPMFIVAYNDTESDVLTDTFPLTDVPVYANMNGNNPYILVSISGEGLAWIREHSSIDKLFNTLKFFNFSCSRIDTACDIFDPDNELVPTILEAFNNDRLPVKGRPIIKSNMKRDWSSTGNLKSYNNKYDNSDKVTENITFGDRQRSTVGLFRLYDKWFEQLGKNQKDKCSEFPIQAMENDYWYRLEFQVVSNSARNSKKYAQQVFDFIAVEGLSSAHAFALVSTVFFTVVISNYNKGKNLDKCFVSSIWEEFIAHNIHFVQFSQPAYIEPDNSIKSFIKYWEHMSKNGVALVLYCESNPAFRDEFLKIGLSKMKKDKSYRYQSIKQLDFLKSYFNKSIA